MKTIRSLGGYDDHYSSRARSRTRPRWRFPAPTCLLKQLHTRFVFFSFCESLEAQWLCLYNLYIWMTPPPCWLRHILEFTPYHILHCLSWSHPNFLERYGKFQLNMIAFPLIATGWRKQICKQVIPYNVTNTIRDICQDSMGTEETDVFGQDSRVGKASRNRLLLSDQSQPLRWTWRERRVFQRLCAQAWRPERAGVAGEAKFSTTALPPSLPSKSRYMFPVPFLPGKEHCLLVMETAG